MKQLLMLAMLIALSITSMAATFSSGSLSYEILTAPSGSNFGTVRCTGLASTVTSSGLALNIPYVVTNGSNTYHVTSIAQGAFSGSRRLAEVRIRYGIDTIYSSAFHGCTTLTKVSIPSSVRMLQAYAFANCSSLTQVYMASLAPGEMSMGSYAFPTASSIAFYCPYGASLDSYRNAISSSYYSSLSHSAEAYDFSVNGVRLAVTQAPTATVNGETTIVGLSSGTTALAPAAAVSPSAHDRSFDLVAVADSAFYGNTSLTLVDLSNLTALKTFGDYAAKGCNRLSTVKLAGGEVGIQAFQGCTALTSITLDGVTSIASKALDGCTSLAGDLVIPATTTSIHYSFIDNCPNVTQIMVDSNNKTYAEVMGCLYDYDNTTLIRVPEGYAFTQLNGLYSTTATIGPGAARNCKFSIATLPYGIKRIGNNAFNGCANLNYVRIPSSVTMMGTRVFQGCTSLATLLVNTYYVPTINPNTMFASRSGIDLRVQRGLVDAFKAAGWTGFKSYNQDGYVAYDAYTRKTNNATMATSNYLAYTVTSAVRNNPKVFGTGTVKVVRGIEAQASDTLTIPATVGVGGYTCKVTCIDTLALDIATDFVLAGCDNVDTIASQAFSGCPALTGITIPAAVSYVSPGFIDGCSKIEEIQVAQGNNNFEDLMGCLYDHGYTTLIRVPEGYAYSTLNSQGCSTILPGAARNCNFSTASLDYGIKEIGDEAFSGCARLDYVRITSSLQSLGERVFQGCDSLATLLVNTSKAPVINPNTMFAGTSGIDLRVQRDMEDAFKAAGWTGFKSYNQDDYVAYDMSVSKFEFDYDQMKRLSTIIAYTVTSTSNTNNKKTGRVKLVRGAKSDNNAATITIPATVSVGGYKCNVSCIETHAFDMPNSYVVNGCENVDTIMPYAFEREPITSIDLPARKIHLGMGAFNQCNELHEIVTRAACTWDGTFFGDNADDFTLYVPVGDVYNAITSSLDNYAFDDMGDYQCSDRVAPCLTATATTYPLPVYSPLAFTASGVNAYEITEIDPKASSATATQVASSDAQGVILTGLTPGEFYKVKRDYDYSGSTSQWLYNTDQTFNLRNVTGGYYWDTDQLKFVRPTSAYAISTDQCYLVATGAGSTISVDFVDAGVTGDINGDGIVDITDVNMAINMVLGKTEKTTAADINGDGTVDITDVNAIINLMLGK